MSMTIGDANDVQLLLRHVLRGGAGQDPDRVPDSDTARTAAAALADRSRRVLHAGQGGDAVAAAWPGDVPQPAAGLQVRLLDKDGDFWELRDDGRWGFEFDELSREQVEEYHGPVREVWIRC